MSKLPRQRKRKRGDKGPLDAGIVEAPCEIEIDVKEKLHAYDSCNALVLPSKKIKFSQSKKKQLQQRPFLSKKKRRELEKIVSTKEKKKNRSALLAELSSVQMPSNTIFSSVMHYKKEAPLKKPKSAREYVEENFESLPARALYAVPKPTPIIRTIREETSEEEEEVAPALTISKSSVKKDEPQKKVKGQKSLPSVFVPVNRPAKIQEARMKLPILAEEQSIMETIRENSILVLAGETGSGKTTQVPQFLYEGGYTSNGKIIGITEPRRVAAISMSARVAEEMNLSSKEVSFLIRFEGNATPSTKILFMTDGVLLREARNDLLLSRYSVIIVDEAHERSVFTDILIGLLSRVVRLRKERGDPLKLIIMSATLRLADFTENSRLFKTPPPVIKVEARQFPVSMHFARRTDDDYISEAYKKACKIHTELPDGGILVFVTGQKEVKFLVQKLRKAFPRNQNEPEASATNGNDCEEPESDSEAEIEKEFDEITKKGKRKKKNKKGIKLNVVSLDAFAETAPEDELADGIEDEEDLNITDCVLPSIRQPLWVLPLYSLLPSYKQALVFKPPPDGVRLCVVATNIAETSLTIPGVKYVVDCGRTKQRKCDKLTGVSTFEVDWTSKASADQRSGRAGRVGPGHCYRLFSSAVYSDKFNQFSIPDILQRPVDDLFLQMKSMGIDKVVNFPFPSPPSIEQLKAAEVKLTLLGILEPPDAKSPGSLTPLGRVVSGFPVTPRFGKMLALSMQHQGLMPHTINLVSALSVEQIILDPGKAVKECALTGQMRDFGDPAVLLRMIYAASRATVQGEEALNDFCELHSLRLKGVKEIWKLRSQLVSEINLRHPELNLNIQPNLKPPTDAQCRLLRQILLAGSVDQVAQKVNELELKDKIMKWKLAYRTEKLEEPVFMSSVCVLKRARPEFVIYQDLFETTKILMRGVTTIEPEWLPIYAPSLCKLSAPLSDPPPRYDPRSQRLICWVTGTFGQDNWELPRMEIDIPNGPDRFKYLAIFIVEGAIFPNLAQFKHILIKNPTSILKPGSLKPKGLDLVNQLTSRQADSREKIVKIWKDEPKYLFEAFKLWLPESAHRTLEVMWPPC